MQTFENALKVAKEIFPNTLISDEIINRLPEAIKTLTEREQCVIQKCIDGMSYDKIGQQLTNYIRPCDGISTQSTIDIYYTALRKLRTKSRRCVWSSEMDADEWIRKKMYGLK